VKAGKANVVKTDMPASNGVIHVVDTVIIPQLPMLVCRGRMPPPAAAHCASSQLGSPPRDNVS
jgi:hypothetical protein